MTSVARVRVFHPHAEAQVAFGAVGHVPARGVRTLASDLEMMLAAVAEPGDVLLVRELPSAAHLDHLAKAGMAVPELLKAPIDSAVLPRRHPLREREIAPAPWAWTPDTCAFFAPLAAHGHAPRWAATRARFWSKAWAADLLADLHPLLAEAPTTPEGPAHPTDTAGSEPHGALEPQLCAGIDVPTVVTSEAELDRVWPGLYREQVATAVCKAPLGTAGRAAIRIPITADGAQLDGGATAWIRRALATQGAVVVAPWRERLADLSVQLDITATDVQIRGITSFTCDAMGRYRAGFIDEPRLSSATVALLRRTALQVGEALRLAGHWGPAGIDAMVFRDPDGKRRLQPLLEVNPRTTIGHLTLGLRHLVGTSLARGSALSILGPRDLRAAGTDPVGLAGQLAPALVLNDPSKAQGHLAVATRL